MNFASKRRAQGVERVAAVVEAGRKRARPILLTTVTTFLGVSPLIFFATGQTRFLSPMAISLGFGLVFTTALILLVLPCFYLVADDLRLHLRLRAAARKAGAAAKSLSDLPRLEEHVRVVFPRLFFLRILSQLRSPSSASSSARLSLPLSLSTNQ